VAVNNQLLRLIANRLVGMRHSWLVRNGQVVVVGILVWSKNSNSLFFQDEPHSLRTLFPLVSPTPILDTPHQKEWHHQGRDNGLLMQLATHETLVA